MRSTLLRRISTTASGSLTIRALGCHKSLLSLTPTLGSTVVADIPDAERGFTLIFSGAPLPAHQCRVDWQREESGGNWYYSADLGATSAKLPTARPIIRSSVALVHREQHHLPPSFRRSSSLPGKTPQDRRSEKTISGQIAGRRSA